MCRADCFCCVRSQVTPVTASQEQTVCVMGALCGFLAAMKVAQDYALPVVGTDIISYELNGWTIDIKRTMFRMLLGTLSLTLTRGSLAGAGVQWAFTYKILVSAIPLGY